MRGLCGGCEGVVWGGGCVGEGGCVELGGGGCVGGCLGGRGLRTPRRFIFHFSRINILLLKLFHYCSTMAPISMSPKIESQITCAYCARLVRGLCGYLQNSVMYWPYTSRIAGYINICMVI